MDMQCETTRLLNIMHALEQEDLALEHEIREEWARVQELESREIQDEGEEFFNSLDPESWEDKNETPFLFKLTKQLRKWNRENFEESTDSIGAEDASSKRLIGEATRWNPRGFGFIKPSDGSEDLLCLLSSIADGNELREGEMVEYEAEYDDRRGKYRAIKVTRKAARNTRKKRTKLPPPGGGGGGGGGGYGGGGPKWYSRQGS
jgi:cold shock CspA family protein